MPVGWCQVLESPQSQGLGALVLGGMECGLGAGKGRGLEAEKEEKAWG